MPKAVREMTQPLRETQKIGDIQTNEDTKHKTRLNTQKKHSAQPGCVNWSFWAAVNKSNAG